MFATEQRPNEWDSIISTCLEEVTIRVTKNCIDGNLSNEFDECWRCFKGVIDIFERAIDEFTTHWTVRSRRVLSCWL